MKTTKVKRVRLKLGLGKLSDLQMVDFGTQVLQKMTGNAHFTTPNPTLAVLQTGINDFNVLVTAPKPHSTSHTADKKAKRKELHDFLTGLGGYVASVANNDPANCVAIAESSGFMVSPSPKPRANGFRGQATKVPGQAKLATDRVKGSVYKWQYTTNPADETTWKTIETSTSRAVLTGLTSAQKYYFRVSVIQKTAGPWSNVISLLVL